MTDSMLESPPRATAEAGSNPCEISSLAEAARALRMMDRELALLRHEHLTLLDRCEKLRLAAVTGLSLGAVGLVVALVSLLTR